MDFKRAKVNAHSNHSILLFKEMMRASEARTSKALRELRGMYKSNPVKEILFSSNHLKLAGPQIIKRSQHLGTLLVGNWHYFIWQS